MQSEGSYMRTVAAGLETVTSQDKLKEEISAEENFSIRRKNTPSTCLLHYDKAPLRLSSAQLQYMYDDSGREYIDCAGSVSGVGHCHPAVVEASRSNIGSLFTAFCDLSMTSALASYPKQLLSRSGPEFDTALFTSTGSEAIDLSLQIARGVTGRHDVVVVDNCFHGCLSTVIEISPRELKRKELVPKEYVHVIPMPDLFRGPHAGKADAAELYFQDAKRVVEAAMAAGRQVSTVDAAELYFQDAKRVVEAAMAAGRQIACFLSEPVMTVAGIVMPPPGWLRKIHDYIHSLGALVISDEMCTALGRNGTTFWGFQAENGAPDFICCGKPIGNGYPMAAALTRSELLKTTNQPRLAEQYRPSPLACAIGSTVLQVLERENLIARARDVGALLKQQLLLLKAKHRHIGDVRGVGLQLGVEFVTGLGDRKPDRQVCQCVVYRLKEDERIIAAAEGEFRNVLYITPPLCFSEENAVSLVAALDRVLSYLTEHGTDIGFSSLGASMLEPEAEEVDLAAYEDVD